MFINACFGERGFDKLCWSMVYLYSRVVSHNEYGMAVDVKFALP